MPTVTDYLAWRGDLSFNTIPVGEADNLIFSLLSYMDLDGIVPAPGEGCITLREAAKEYFFVRDQIPPKPLGLIVPAEIVRLFRAMADTPRFSDLLLCGYVNEISEAREMQFSAMTVRLPDDSAFVAFRGTDDTIVGWREDFNLSYMDEVPSQRKAADYLNALDLPFDMPLYVGGHSKGGNLAVWGAVHADATVRRRILRAFSNDGPGFSTGMIRSESYMELADRISVFVPDDSLVGLLLEHDENYAVVKSTRRGLFQHDALTWEIMGGSFVRSDGLSKRGLRAETVIRERIDAMTREERAAFVRLLFTVLESTGAKTLTDFQKAGLRAATAMVRTVAGFTKEDQETGIYLLGKLFFPKENSKEKGTPDLPGAEKVPGTAAEKGASPRQEIPASTAPKRDTKRSAKIRVEFAWRRRHQYDQS